MITSSNINWKIDTSKQEGIQNINDFILPSHFLGLICGKRKYIKYIRYSW
jgi:hypothetical protein